MNLDLLNNIIERLQTSVYHKSRSKRLAKKLLELRDEYINSKDENQKAIIDRKVDSQVFNYLINCLDRKSREEMSSLGCAINEYSYLLERQFGYEWKVGQNGVVNRTVTDNQYVTSSFIDREYRKGYYLTPADPDNEEEKEVRKKHVDFYMQNIGQLNKISDCMDRKAELVTYDYKLASDKVSRDFVELMIDYLGYTRLTEEQVKKYRFAYCPTREYPRRAYN